MTGLWYNNKDGNGVTFEFTIPLEKTEWMNKNYNKIVSVLWFNKKS